MKSLFTAVVVTVLMIPALAPAQSIKVGILPFDAVSVDGADAASTALPKLVRIEMIKARKVTPQVLDLAPGAQTPVPAEQAAALGKTAGVRLVIVGTVTAADVEQSSHGADTGGFLGSLGVGGQISRTKVTVGLHIELVDPVKGDVVDTFEVEGSNSETGLGMNLSTALGDVNSGGTQWDKSPIGKALQDAAKKVSDEVAKRAAKLAK